MRADLRDSARRPLGRVVLDPAARPTRVALPESGREVFLTWDSAVDDGGHLRRCVACGSAAMFRTKSFPQVTVFVVLLAFAGAVVAALGYAADPKVLTAMVVVLLVDVAILLFSKPLLVCYRCRSTFADLPIARYHRRWDSREAERHPAESTRVEESAGGGAVSGSALSSPDAARTPPTDG